MFGFISKVGEKICVIGDKIIMWSVALITFALVPYVLFQSKYKLLNVALRIVGTLLSGVLVVFAFTPMLIGMVIGGIVFMIGKILSWV